MERHLDYWTVGVDNSRIKYTPKGLAWLNNWGSLRYATTTAFLAAVYAIGKDAARKRQKYTTILQRLRLTTHWAAQEEVS